MDERRLELKVGALVLATVLGVFALLWLMGELTLGSDTGLAVDFGHFTQLIERHIESTNGISFASACLPVKKLWW